MEDEVTVTDASIPMVVTDAPPVTMEEVVGKLMRATMLLAQAKSMIEDRDNFIETLQIDNAALFGRAVAAEANLADADRNLVALLDRLTKVIDSGRPPAPPAGWPEDETTAEVPQ